LIFLFAIIERIEKLTTHRPQKKKKKKEDKPVTIMKENKKKERKKHQAAVRVPAGISTKRQIHTYRRP
jgi:Na+-translocating ferredoxin:NAD+ oxidoreductase RNF subunit RnfB